MSYARSDAYTTDHTQVGGSNITDFNIVLRGTFPELATVANGGFIYNLGTFGDPADFVVSPNPDGSSKYDFQVPVYDPTTGLIEIYFRIPTLSASADQVFYLVYSDPAVTTFQGSAHVGPHPEWANYKGVYHFHGGLSTDATASAAHGIVSGPIATTAVVGTGLLFEGGSDVVNISLSTSGFAFPDYARPMTIEFWEKAPPTGSTNPTILQAASYSGNFLIYHAPKDVPDGVLVDSIAFFVGFTGGARVVGFTADNAWHHFVFAVDATGNLTVTIDGVIQPVTTVIPGPLQPRTSTALKFGNGLGALNGALDEVRFSNIDRISASNHAYAVAAYNNQKLGSTFIRRFSTIAGYRDSKRFTIDHTQVGGVDLTNFPIVVRGTYPELKSATNGGRIQNLIGALPCDFVVSPNIDGSSKYDFEVAEYDPTTGAIEVWFRRPTLSASVDGTFYFAFNDPTVTTYQGTPTGAHTEWDLNYKGVYHLADGLATDSTSSHFQGDVMGPTQTTGIVDTALAFPGGTAVVEVPTFVNYTRPMTFEFWAKLPTAVPRGGQSILQASSLVGHFLLYSLGDIAGRGFSSIDVYTSGGEAGILYPTDGAWHHYVIAIDSSGNLIGVMDGVLQKTIIVTAGALTPSTTTDIKMGNGGAPLTGSLDEVRFSNIARISASNFGYAVAAYNNQKLTSTFITSAVFIESGDLDEEWDEQEWDASVISP